MKCAVMQPTYLPWLGYFDLIDSVDKFVFLDDVKLEKSSWHVRNRIKTAQEGLYLTVPVKMTKGRDKLLINETLIQDNVPWRKKHLRSIFYAYRKSAFFDEVYPVVESIINANIERLADFNIGAIKSISVAIGIQKEFIRSSTLKGVSGKKDARVVSICKNIDCSEYISPKGAADYIEKDRPGGQFPGNNIDLFYQNYEHPVYNQLYGEFLPYMSIVDLLFNHGFNKSLIIVRKGRRDAIPYRDFRISLLKGRN